MTVHASDIANALTRHFKSKGKANMAERFLCGEEVRVSSWDSPRIADFIAQDTWQGGYYGDNPMKHPRYGFEIKVSRSDWLAELKQPDKAMAFIPYMHYWSLAIADHVEIKDGELPNGWGLYVVKNGKVSVKKHPVANRQVQPMPEGMRISFLRRVVERERQMTEQKLRKSGCPNCGVGKESVA